MRELQNLECKNRQASSSYERDTIQLFSFFVDKAQNGTFKVAPLFRWAETTEALCQELDNLLARHRLTDYASIIFSTINLIMIFTEHPRLTYFFFLVCIPVICAEHFKILTLQDI